METPCLCPLKGHKHGGRKGTGKRGHIVADTLFFFFFSVNGILFTGRNIYTTHSTNTYIILTYTLAQSLPTLLILILFIHALVTIQILQYNH